MLALVSLHVRLDRAWKLWQATAAALQLVTVLRTKAYRRLCQPDNDSKPYLVVPGRLSHGPGSADERTPRRPNAL